MTAQYHWDAENRLIEVGPAEGVTPEAGDLRVEFVYDHLGRRVQKSVTVWDPTLNGGQGGWSTVLEGAATHRFLWDGWRMLIEWIDTPEGGMGVPPVILRCTCDLNLGGLMGAGGSGLGGGSALGGGTGFQPVNGAAVLEATGTIGGLLALHDNAGTPTNPADDRDYAYLYDMATSANWWPGPRATAARAATAGTRRRPRGPAWPPATSTTPTARPSARTPTTTATGWSTRVPTRSTTPSASARSTGTTRRGWGTGGTGTTARGWGGG